MSFGLQKSLVGYMFIIVLLFDEFLVMSLNFPKYCFLGDSSRFFKGQQEEAFFLVLTALRSAFEALLPKVHFLSAICER